jgi:acyl-CoA thioester hydrolase
VPAVSGRRNRMTDSFEMTVSVLPSDIDEQNHVNNMVYLRWIQEVAIAHWRVFVREVATDRPSPEADHISAIGWVVRRHEIDYKSPATLGDEVILRTWVGQAVRLTFERFTEIRRGRDDQLVASARTLWVPINTKTTRPTRVSPEVRRRFTM